MSRTKVDASAAGEAQSMRMTFPGRGKVDRLPYAIRAAIEQRLAEGHTGEAIRAWLNSLPIARETLAQQFTNWKISAKNLSEYITRHPCEQSRCGVKLQHLPADLADELNYRIEMGAQDSETLDWLNAHSEVKEMLGRLGFKNPIAPQDLQKWRKREYKASKIRGLRERARQTSDFIVSVVLDRLSLEGLIQSAARKLKVPAGDVDRERETLILIGLCMAARDIARAGNLETAFGLVLERYRQLPPPATWKNPEFTIADLSSAFGRWRQSQTLQSMKGSG